MYLVAKTFYFTSDKPHYPYQLPERWKWCKLEDIATFGGGKTPSMDIKEYWNKGKNLWVTSKDMKNDSIHDSLMKITDEALNIMTQYEKDTLLVVTRSGILRHTLPIAILEKKATINQDIKSIMPLNGIIPKFLFYAIKANENIILTEYHKDGTTVDSIDFDKFKCLPIPLPPINEQKRIITEVLKVSASIDCIDCGKADLYTAIAQAKSKILDLAIHGKLVPQDPTDETASELLKRINPKAEITSDNGHYQKLPEGWCECKLSDVCVFDNGYAFSSDNYNDCGIPLIRISNITNTGSIDLSSCVFIQDVPSNKFIVKSGDLLIAMSGATTGKMGVYLYEENALLNQRVGNLKCTDAMLQQYRNYYMFAKSDYILKIAYGGAQPNISAKAILDIDVMLPPLKEQHRIVTKIEEIFAQLDAIEASL